MASSSTSSGQKSFKYDVFISFRGEDTRKTFVDHLYLALDKKGVITYKDDEKIQKGERICEELMRSIEDSKFYIIVFSKNYASSSWCLDELVKIMECQRMTEHTLYPVFYDVEPTDIRKQTGPVKRAFAKHRKEDDVGKWRDALKEAAGLAGWELKNTAHGHEAKFIQEIVDKISLRLHCINLNVDRKLVGMADRVKDIVSLLDMSVNDVRVIGIKGMGGGGKTTLARATFDQISMEFEGSSFVENVREVSKDSSKGLKSLQKQILSDVLNDQGISVSGVSDGKNKMKRILHCRKVLVVLDDVDHIDQLEALASEPSWFKKGSRIIITTREEQVLKAHRVNFIHEESIFLIRDVNLLSVDEAICLFSRYAFGKEIPIQEYENLSEKVVRYAAGLPLTIKVLGSHLCGKSYDIWTDALERLKTIPLKETLEKLELSYNGLEDDCKEIFLNVACMLKGWEKDEAIRALESCGYHAKNGLKVLKQKSLITISNYGYLGMHDHIEEMGANIVRRLYPNEPNKHSRLWIEEETKDILAKNLGTEATRYLCLWNVKLHPAIVMKGLGKMKELRFLYVDNSFRYYQNFDEDSQYLPNALQFICWYRYPFACLPRNFEVNNLVGLQMHYSSIIQLWERGERKVLKKLKFIDLSNSNLRTLDPGLIPNLEMLILRACVDLVELDLRFRCQKLRILDLSYSKIKALDLGPTSNLETINLTACEDLIELHMFRSPSLKFLHLSRSKLRIIHLGWSPNLAVLSLEGCDDLEELQMPVGSVKLKSFELMCSNLKILDLSETHNLESLDLRGCGDLIELHMPDELKSFHLNHSKLRNLDLSRILNMETLYLDKCSDLVELHMPLKSPMLKSIKLSLSKLRSLHLGQCLNLKELSLKSCGDLEVFHLPTGSVKLESFALLYSNLSILDLSRTQNLERLDLQGCGNLVELQMPVELKSLYLNHSKLRTLDLAQTRNLERLEIRGNRDLVELHMPVELKSLYLSDSKLRTLDLAQTRNLERLEIRGNRDLVELHLPIDLKSFYLSVSKLRNLNLSQMVNLETLYVNQCLDLVELQLPVESLKLNFFELSVSILTNMDLARTTNLQTLYLEDCSGLESFLGRERTVDDNILELLKDLHPLECPKELKLSSRGIKHLPNSICMLKHLKVLKIKRCMFLEQLEEDIGRLECLEELHLSFGKITHLPDSFCMLKHLKVLRLDYYNLLEQLPEDIGRLECLEELQLSSGKITHLPDSICMLKHLKVLKLAFCKFLRQLPEDVGRLERLEKLILSHTMIKHLPSSICMLKHLQVLGLASCRFLKQLPEDLGRLECLEFLILSFTEITHLPNSICMLKHLKVCRHKDRRPLQLLPEDNEELFFLDSEVLIM